MNCSQFRKKIPDYLEQRLSADAEKEMSSHLDHCQEFLHLKNQFQEVEALISRERNIELNPFAETRIIAGVMKHLDQSRESARLSWIPVPVKLSVAMLFALFAGVAIGYLGVIYFPETNNRKQQAEMLRQDLNIPDFMKDDIVNIENPPLP